MESTMVSSNALITCAVRTLSLRLTMQTCNGLKLRRFQRLSAGGSTFSPSTSPSVIFPANKISLRTGYLDPSPKNRFLSYFKAIPLFCLASVCSCIAWMRDNITSLLSPDQQRPLTPANQSHPLLLLKSISLRFTEVVWATLVPDVPGAP